MTVYRKMSDERITLSFPLKQEPIVYRVRLYRADSGAVIVIGTELLGASEAGTVDTAEVATKIWSRAGRPEPFTWIEHYPANPAAGGEYDPADRFTRAWFAQRGQEGFRGQPALAMLTLEEVFALIEQGETQQEGNA